MAPERPHEEGLIHLPMDQIIVPPGQRTLHDVTALMEPIQDVGLLDPISVSPEYQLIAGYHRVEAFRRLGRTEIPAIICDLDALQAALAKIDENLIRHELTALERAVHLRRRKEIYARLHPQSKAMAGPGRGHREKPRKDFAAFTTDTAFKTGSSRRTIEQEVQIATRLGDTVKESIRTLPIADKKVELLQLARLSADVQEAVAAQLASGQAKSVHDAQRALAPDADARAAPVKMSPSPVVPTSGALPAEGRVDLTDRDTLLDVVVAQLTQVPAMAEATIEGQPAAYVLAQRLALLPWPELVLLAGCVRGQTHAALTAWMAAVCANDEMHGEDLCRIMGAGRHGHSAEALDDEPTSGDD